MTDGGRYALALSYKPGSTPEVLAVSRSSADWKELCWAGQEAGLPLVESPEVNAEACKAAKLGEPIPASLFKVVAHGLALLARNRQSPVSLKLIKPVSKAPSSLKKRCQASVAELTDKLQASRILLQVDPVGQQKLDCSAILDTVVARAVVDLGVPLGDPQVEVNEALEPGHFQLHFGGALQARAAIDQETPESSMARSIFEALELQAWRLLGFRETEALTDNVKKEHKSLYRELFPSRLRLGLLRAVLRNLLREQVSIADLKGILESLVDHLETSENPEILTELVRGDMRHYLSTRFGDRAGRLHALMFEPSSEKALLKALRVSEAGGQLDLDESLTILGSVARVLETNQNEAHPLVVLCAPRIRRFLRRLLEPSFPFLPVMSYTEVAPLTDVLTEGMVGR